jgi:putative heme-binding domain-containing protein
MRAWAAVLMSITLSLVASAGEVPPVQMLVPGFTVRELPLKISNLNNLEYTADGKLWALGYDGRVHMLTDSDGDGLEDTDKIYWANAGGEFRGPIGMMVAPEGVYVSSKGRVSFLPDADHDGVADKCETITTGWKENFTNVDALGMARDEKGNFYFGLGCANFANAYEVEKATGKAKYDIKSERGTILKLSPDFKTREIVCTGIRFPVSIKINRLGDLFCTEQEGATWCPGGNVVDKLMHIQQGRHYGFPPRHPEYLPDVIDEPPTVSFGPQHQSTCGMKFNEAKAGWKSFGPPQWEGDALVTGESRGKIYRAKIVKTPAGYVGGRPAIIACTSMLTVDLAVSPAGDLVVCCHSGPPDWGTGPKGAGRVFKISYSDPKAPQPVIAWAEAANEIRVAFDKPLDVSVALAKSEIHAGEFVRAGDRFETLVPPYVAVKSQRLAGWRTLKVERQELSEDARTLKIFTEPLPWRGWYALAIPGVKAPGVEGFGASIDVDFELGGISSKFRPDDEKSNLECWLPHPDSSVCAELLKGSAEWERISRMLGKSGGLIMEAALELKGNKATHSYFSKQILGPTKPGITSFGDDKGFHMSFDEDIDKNEAFKIIVRTDEHSFVFECSYHTDIDPIERPLRLEQLVPQWARALPRQTVPAATNPYLQVPNTHVPSALTAGGDWQKGHDLFYGEAKCSGCHSIRGEGATFAPDLSNLAFRDPESVQRDIFEPNLAINPDFTSFVVKLKDGRAMTGLVQTAGADQYRIVENAEKITTVSKADVKEMRPSAESIMPAGFKELLGPEKMRDLLMFLTGEAPKKK